MGSDKTYIFDGGGTGGGLDIAALVSSMMSNKGMDPNLVAALMNGNNNRGSWGGDGCWWIWIIYCALFAYCRCAYVYCRTIWSRIWCRVWLWGERRILGIMLLFADR